MFLGLSDLDWITRISCFLPIFLIPLHFFFFYLKKEITRKEGYNSIHRCLVGFRAFEFLFSEAILDSFFWGCVVEGAIGEGSKQRKKKVRVFLDLCVGPT